MSILTNKLKEFLNTSKNKERSERYKLRIKFSINVCKLYKESGLTEKEAVEELEDMISYVKDAD